jgi:hypothetical protein
VDNGGQRYSLVASAADSMATMVEDGARAAKSGVRKAWGKQARLLVGLGVDGFGDTAFMMA